MKDLPYIFKVVLILCLLSLLVVSNLTKFHSFEIRRWLNLEDFIPNKLNQWIKNDTAPGRTSTEFQLLNDNVSYVYAGYYDDREKEAEIKIIAVMPNNISYRFICRVHYPDRTDITVKAHVKYISRGDFPGPEARYWNAFIVCPVSKEKTSPTSVTLQKDGVSVSKTIVSVIPVPKVKNKLTRCISPIMRNYSDVSELISNIEFHRIFGVDKFVLYVTNSSQLAVDVLKSYSDDGIVEFRNYSIPVPVKRMEAFLEKDVYWAQWSSYQDCLLSQMYSAKYVLFGDLDEIVVPRKHRKIWKMADDLFNEYETKNRPLKTGSLTFRNVYYPRFKNQTRISYPQKDKALKYKIYPLLYTTRMKTNDFGIVSKTLVRPLSVELMWIHCVQKFKKGWTQLGFVLDVNASIAANHHYRIGPNQYMPPPETQDDYMLKFSEPIIRAVRKRFEKALPYVTKSKISKE